MPELKFTRAQYLTGECSHNEYYSQFVTPEIKAAIRSYFGIDRILASTDKHFNDIPLERWDMFTGYNAMQNKLQPNPVFQPIIGLLKQANGSGGYSPSDFNCIAKQATREIVQENS